MSLHVLFRDLSIGDVVVLTGPTIAGFEAPIILEIEHKSTGRTRIRIHAVREVLVEHLSYKEDKDRIETLIRTSI